MIDLHLRLGPLTLDINLSRTTHQPATDEPPYIDTKYAADLGSPSGFGLILRPDHVDSE